MKNHEEFRQIVFEKAKIYEEKRKKRHKKIIEASSLCSLCVIIGISAYFGLDSLHLMEEDAHIAVTEEKSLTDNKSSHPEIFPTNGESMESSSIAPSSTSTAAHTVCTTEETVAATTEATIEATIEATTQSPAETTSVLCETSACITVTEETLEAFEETYTLLGEFEYGQTDFSEASTKMILCPSLQSLEYVIENKFPYISSKGLSFLRGNFEKEYFEDHSLILVLSSDAWLWEAQLADGIFTYSAIGENPSGEGKLSILVYSVPTNAIMIANFPMQNNE